MGNWIKRQEGWIPRQNKREDALPDQAEEGKDENNSSALVIFIKPKCPKCGNKNLRCNGVNENVRYFKCKCGHNFKAIEKN
ncbi:MAG: hypothetical protein NTY47_03465 [Candidatus Omnitrophica bacterium]|nr:hypothetical protein [Candidatus Omnitrophota bacterium]